MRAEYDLSGKKATKGKYADAFKKGYIVRTYDSDKLVNDKFFASIDGDVREYFPDSRAVNKALRTLISTFPESPEPRAR